MIRYCLQIEEASVVSKAITPDKLRIVSRTLLRMLWVNMPKGTVLSVPAKLVCSVITA